jgi:hypothetical protein
MALQQAIESYRDLPNPAWDRQRTALRGGAEPNVDLGAGLGLVSSVSGYASTADVRHRAVGAANRQVKVGLEELFEKMLSFWNLTADEGAALVGYAPQGASKIARIFAGLATFDSVDERDRILLLYDIRKLLAGLFRSRELENRWLRTPNPGLDGQSPLNVLLTRTFPNLLKVKQFIEHLAGV